MEKGRLDHISNHVTGVEGRDRVDGHAWVEMNGKGRTKAEMMKIDRKRMKETLNSRRVAEVPGGMSSDGESHSEDDW